MTNTSDAISGILDRLEPLAAELGTTVEYLWRVQVEWVVADAWGALILGGIGLLIAALLGGIALFALRAGYRCCDNKKDPGGPFATVLIAGFVCIVVTATSVSTVVGKIPVFMCPEGAALQDILQALK